MTAYVVWNNKGGTGKTTLAFHIIAEYAIRNPTRRILAIDLCPQANLSELLLGGLIQGGAANLAALFVGPVRRSIGGYFQHRFTSPYAPPPGILLSHYCCVPSNHNVRLPANITLLAGDPLIELQSNAISTLASTQIPTQNTWQGVIDWVRDLIAASASAGEVFDDVFIDANPSFSMYTQIALATGNRLILPATADESSRRGIHNVLSLVYGVQLPGQYQAFSFAGRMQQAGRALPLTHLIVKNRLTQYMGPATAYASILSGIDADFAALFATNPNLFTFTNVAAGMMEIRDFQTTGVVALAYGSPFSRLPPGMHAMPGGQTRVNRGPWQECVDEIQALVARL